MPSITNLLANSADYAIIATDSGRVFEPFSFTAPVQLAAVNIAPDSDIDTVKLTFTDNLGNSFTELCGIGAPISAPLMGNPISQVTIAQDNPRKFIDPSIAAWFDGVTQPVWNYPKIGVDSSGAALSNSVYTTLRLQTWFKPPTVNLPYRRIPKTYYYVADCPTGAETTVARIPGAGRKFIRVTVARPSGTSPTVTLRIYGLWFNHTANESITFLQRLYTSVSVATVTAETLTWYAAFGDAFVVTVNNASGSAADGLHFAIEVRDEPTAVATEF